MTRLEQACQAKNDLIAITEDITTPALEEACLKVLHHPRFTQAFGSAGQHHVYEGGLAIHTYEVATYAMNMARMFPAKEWPYPDMDVVLTSAIFHDFMKVREYGSGTVPLKTPYRNLIRHVAGSHAEFLLAIEGKNVPEDKIVKIEHAILAHHGRMEWGSPVEPQLIEAVILHDADMLSVQFGPGR